MNITEQKGRLRTEMLARRALLSAVAQAAAADGLVHIFRSERPFDDAKIAAAFWPMPGELDVRPLMEEIAALGCRLALPVVVGRGQPLLFRSWAKGEALEKGVFGTQHPGPAAPVVEPDALIVPLLACDGDGWRLGYGGGFYDRTLLHLRSRKEIVAIGVAFDSQFVPEVPHGPEDQRLDWLLTDKRACAFV